MKVVLLGTWLIVRFALCIKCELVINAKNQGGELVTETLFANTSDDTVMLELRKTDGTHVTVLTDFKNNANVFRLMILGEEELGEQAHKVLCFLLRVPIPDVIPPEAMSKLRQKNPGTVRVPEDDKGLVETVMDVSLLPEVLGPVDKHALSPHLPSLCGETVSSVYAKEDDVKFWHERDAVADVVVSYARLNPDSLLRCKDLVSPDDACVCRSVVSIPCRQVIMSDSRLHFLNKYVEGIPDTGVDVDYDSNAHPTPEEICGPFATYA
ncbi:unnamed protein product [Notodromas monacha]|uniref:Out at first protein BRICHOS-like domain-containing protein n=1 Tax=Notodromas monacha TaxID=399045 RepID=A0A7R9BCM7_9CRUS|nr:unnamed protein product [Notodromas monacha]CAG0912842.1 unnamed protein product [Notodromas monacha]